MNTQSFFFFVGRESQSRRIEKKEALNYSTYPQSFFFFYSKKFCAVVNLQLDI
jgi:hypothetical protein